MNKILEILLPIKADNALLGSKWPLYLFILVAVIGAVRSRIHIFSRMAARAVLPGWIWL